MIRVARSEKQRRVLDELTMPSPARIQRMTEQIRRTWSPATKARRAGQARRVQIMVVSAFDLFDSPTREDF